MFLHSITVFADARMEIAFASYQWKNLHQELLLRLFE
jgi:hypothetical protein